MSEVIRIVLAGLIGGVIGWFLTVGYATTDIDSRYEELAKKWEHAGYLRGAASEMNKCTSEMEAVSLWLANQMHKMRLERAAPNNAQCAPRPPYRDLRG